MSNSIIIGDGGLAKEVAFHLKKNDLDKDFIGFIGFQKSIGDTLYSNFKVIGIYDKSKIYDLLRKNNISKIFIGISNNTFRKEIFNDLDQYEFEFPNLIDKSVFFDNKNLIGFGNLILHGSLLTCNIQIGNFNIFNGMVGVGHDVSIGNFNYFGPSSNISGEVEIGNSNSFHLKSSIIQNRRIGNNNTINMYSVVVKNLRNDNTMFGIPALKIHK